MSKPSASLQAAHTEKAQGSLPEPFATVLNEVLQDLRSDAQVKAVFLGGSLALGQSSPRSDLDLVVIKSENVEVMERYVRYVEGVQVQVIAGPPRQFDIWLETDRPSGTVIRQLANGQLLLDRGGLGARYRSLAQDTVAAGLEPMSRPQIRSRRFLLTELLADVADCADDPPRARWLMDTGLAFVVETAFLWHQQWTPKGKRALAEIETLDPRLSTLCRDFLSATNPASEWSAFEQLVEHVLAPLGGELREPWTRPPEAVPPPPRTDES
jgi:predicted nucleotidyltransferase